MNIAKHSRHSYPAMTKRELIDALAPYADDQYVYVRLHTERFPEGCQIIIQGVKPNPPWHPGPDLIGIECHERNKELPK